MSNDVEIAPKGTRKLLEEVASHLRRDEAMLRDRIPEASDPGQAGKAMLAKINEEADRAARLAGRVESTLRGWED